MGYQKLSNLRQNIVNRCQTIIYGDGETAGLLMGFADQIDKFARFFGMVAKAAGRGARHWLWLLPIGAAAAGAECGWTVDVYIHIAAAEAATMLATNPLGFFDRALSPASRLLLIVADIAAWVAMTCRGVKLSCRVYLAAAAALMAFAAISQRKRWLTDSMIRQSGAVNRASGMIYGKGDHDALTEWEKRGSAEARALIRQTLQLILDEDELHSKCKAVYVLGFLHGEARNKRELDALRKKSGKIDKTRQAYRSALDAISERDLTISELEYSVRRAERQAQEANRRAAEAEARLDALGLTAALDAQTDPVEDKKWAVYRTYKSSGQSMAKVAKQFDISAQTVKNYCDWCEARKPSQVGTKEAS